MSNNEIKGLIFDYGGTLDTRGRHWAYVLMDGYKYAEINIDEEKFREAYVFAERELAKNPIIKEEDNFYVLLQKKIDIETRYLVENKLWNVEETERIEKTEKAAKWCYCFASDVVKESASVLKHLSEKYPIVLVSNFYGNISTILKDFDINQYFNEIIESAVVGVRKPNPLIYQLGIDAIKLKPSEVMVVGDSYDKDIVPATSLGCKTAWIKGESWNKNEKICPQSEVCEIDNLKQLYEILGL